MAGQGFDPNFTFAWPTARIGVMEGDSAIRAVHGPELDKLQKEGKPIPEELRHRIEKTSADYDRWLDAKFAAARGHVDALLDPLATRRILTFALEATAYARHDGHLVLERMD
jgi:acetyl-CoA carboxylase carboxyltransferase component